MKTLVLVLLSLVIAPAATASTALRWQPTHMARVIVAAKYPIGDTTGAKCVGIGKPTRRGYVAFKCTYTRTLSTGTQTETLKNQGPVWAKPRKVGFCASTVSLSACKPVTP